MPLYHQNTCETSIELARIALIGKQVLMRLMVFFIGVFPIFPILVYAQSEIPENIEELMVDFAETSNMEPNEEEVIAYQTLGKKININRLNAGDLTRIPFLTSLQINNLTEYVIQYGEVFSLYELQAVEGFDSVTIMKLHSYIEIGDPPPRVRLTPVNLIREGRHDLVLRYQQVLQQQAGYHVADSIVAGGQGTFYIGSPQRYYFRYRYNFFDRVVIGFSGDKDAGEEFFQGSQPNGMDFYSGFVVIRNLKWVKQVVAGNFRASFGQRLTFGGSSFGSSVGFGSTMIYNAGFSPSQSVCEYGQLRGVAVTLSTGPLEWSGFLSITRRDASIYLADTADRGSFFFNSFTETGYHRTATEIARKNQVKEQLYGGHVSYRGKFFLVGLTGYVGSWSGSLQPNQEVYRQFMLEGSKFGGLGIDGRCRIGFVQLFGEYSLSLNGGLAWMAGASIVPVSGVDLLLICRSYQPQFQNPYATAISQNSMSANERGCYLRLQTQAIPKTIISGYIDLFRFPWLRYQVNSPSDGIEIGLHARYQLNTYFSVALRYCFKAGVRNNSLFDDGMIPSVAEERKNDLKLECSISPIPVLTLRSCIALRSYQSENLQREMGYLGSQEIAYTGVRIIHAIRMKYTLFDIPFYNARIYMYEPDLLYSFSAPACYGRGIRCVLLVQAGLSRKIDIWGYFGVLKYFDRMTIGTDLEEIDGSFRSEVKVQVRVRL